MPISLQDLAINELSVDERLALVDALLESVAAESGSFLLTATQRQELDRRLTDDDSNPEDVIPWKDVKATLLRGK